MADQLATPADLAILLDVPLDEPRMTLLIEAATAVVQSAAGQRIVEVDDDTAMLLGTTDSWLDLPQRPVTAVTSVELDGSALSAGVAGSGGCTYRRFGSRLFRGEGWQQYCGEPSTVEVVYTHGYPAGSQELQLARKATLGLAAGVYDNPGGGATRESIDDYTVQFEAAAALMEESPHLKSALRRAYGRRAGLVRIG